MNETETHETIIMTAPTGAVPAAEVPTPVKAAQEFIQWHGSVASGEGTTPEQDAEQRVHASGTFAAGEEEERTG